MKKINIIQRIRDMTMLQKLIIGFLVVFITPILFIGFISYRNYEKSIKSITNEYVTQILEEMISKLDNQISKMEKTTLIPYYMSDLQDTLQIQGYIIDKEDAMLKYISLLNAYVDGNTYVYVYDMYGNAYSRSGNNERYNIKGYFNEYSKLATDADGKSVVLGTQEITDAKGRKRYYMTIMRSIKEMSLMQTIGVIVVDTDVSIVENAVKKLEKITSGKVVIIDKDNHIIYDNTKRLIAQKYSDPIVLENLKKGSKRFRIFRESEPYICISSYLERLDWKIVVTIPEAFILKDALKTSKIIILISSIAGAVALSFFVLLSYSIVKPLRKLKVYMKKVQEGNLDFSIQVKNHDEAGMVCDSFNNMVGRLRALINEIYVTNLRKKQIEIETLQKQINPHFIYNTLETVRMLSVLHKTDDINDVMHVFGKLLRYGINYINDLVTVNDEINHLKDYIYLQNKCFTKEISLEIRIDESLISMKMIKLIFQPIVENSIIHGFKNKREGGKIIIATEQLENYIIFKICDNGKGIKPDTLLELNKIMNLKPDEVKTSKSIGLRNVNERMKLYYGDEYGLVVNNSAGTGTEVYIRFPRLPV